MVCSGYQISVISTSALPLLTFLSNRIGLLNPPIPFLPPRRSKSSATCDFASSLTQISSRYFPAQGFKLAKKYGMKYLECSTFTGQGVREVIQCVADIGSNAQLGEERGPKKKSVLEKISGSEVHGIGSFQLYNLIEGPARE
ncbi:hypothetical protein BDK51DRAFT_50515 [Blyttiomyces helicus]|uniref:Uncharacterized protein n=1 Tax=Blyttiomyces helicus TaxID=388810 RepID=A0A4P9W899_9FUNG|nr:hypothetical protein BDK51DRAFT_50515 [Blyttiomyces helicus]|eukprot:RKO87298.1 hypothetical protein BDK51DRAFT_50515 [Blyttiomyces helicus]